MDKFLKHDVFIGREIQSQCFGVTMDAVKFQIYSFRLSNKEKGQFMCNIGELLKSNIIRRSSPFVL